MTSTQVELIFGNFTVTMDNVEYLSNINQIKEHLHNSFKNELLENYRMITYDSSSKRMIDLQSEYEKSVDNFKSIIIRNQIAHRKCRIYIEKQVDDTLGEFEDAPIKLDNDGQNVSSSGLLARRALRRRKSARHKSA